MDRDDKREEDFIDLLNNMEFLGNPMNEMNIEEKKRHALHHYYCKLKVRRGFLNWNSVISFKLLLDHQ